MSTATATATKTDEQIQLDVLNELKCEPLQSPSMTPFVDQAVWAEWRISREELAVGAGISVTRLGRLVRMGIVDPVLPGTREFTVGTLVRLRRMLRLQRDLGVNMTGAAIIAELVDRLERLEVQLSRLRASP
jgi:chaperone modulatory protein CbpM